MDREQELTERLKDIETSFEQERQRWQREKEEYQNLCTWYANSLRYQLGGLFVNALKHPGKAFKLPIEIFHLVQKHRQQSEVKDIESIIATSDTSEKEIIDLDFVQIENAVNSVRKTGITIIVPVFNAYEELCKCVDSIISNTSFPYELLLINDCSTDLRIAETLSHYSLNQNIKVLTNEKNIGYIKSVNLGIQESNTDVLVLNSDTIVTSKWLEKMVIAAYSDQNIMTVTPFSNAAGVFSVPEMNTNNEILPHWNIEDVSKIIENQSQHTYERIPTGNGFCMYIKREAFEQIGIFDEETFGRGYCEENDFCMRLITQGFYNIICDDTYIYHCHTASFKGEKKKLLQQNKEILLSKYPQYDYLVGKMLQSDDLQKNSQRIREAISIYSKEGVVKRNILYVIQNANGGSVKTNEDLMGYIYSQKWNVFMLNSDCRSLRLYQFSDGVLHLLKKWDLNRNWDINTHRDLEWRNIYFNVLFNFHIDIVHIRHLYKHTFDVVDVAEWLGIPMVLSFHDFYYICPTTNLINEKGFYCNADCTSTTGKCRISEPFIKITGSLPKWLESNWRRSLEEIFGKINTFVTTSEYSKALYERIFNDLKERIQVYEHGRKFDYLRKFYGSVPDNTSKIRIMLAGNIDYNKGANYISRLLDADEMKRLEFHCIGNLPEELKTKVVYYGKYIREDFKDYVVRIKPSYVGIFSIWPETYCHIITEAFSCGIPCIVSEIGTLRERGQKGGCIFADLNNPSVTCQRIYATSDEQTSYQQLVKDALGQSIRSVEDMGLDYLRLYESLVIRRQND